MRSQLLPTTEVRPIRVPRTVQRIEETFWFAVVMVGLCCWWGLAFLTGNSLKRDLEEANDAE